MFSFTRNFLLALVSIAGLIIVAMALFLVTTPRPTNLRSSCTITPWHHVHLCPKDATYAHSGQISKYVKAAVVSSEDTTFYQHNGIDWYEMRQSFDKDWQIGHFMRGGSTITQQLARNVYLSGDKSILRKVREALIAVEIERVLSKDEIIEKYLNVVEFGNNIYGVTAAAKYYFGKSPAQLSPMEGAFLAFLLPSPKKYSVSFRNRKLTPFARKMIKSILMKMNAFHKIDDGEYQSGLAELENMFGTAPAMGNESEDYNLDSVDVEETALDRLGAARAADKVASPSDDDVPPMNDDQRARAEQRAFENQRRNVEQNSDGLRVEDSPIEAEPTP